MTAVRYRIALTQGDPAGCGPDLCAELLTDADPPGVELIYVGDTHVLRQRAELLARPVRTEPFDPSAAPKCRQPGSCAVLEIPLGETVTPGQTSPAHQHQVVESLGAATRGCLAGDFDALVTAPVHKASLRQAGFDFVGQTEWLADLCRAPRPLMTFVAGDLKVALATTHLPLAQVPAAIDSRLVLDCLLTLNEGLERYFQLSKPRLLVCGLNPHAGEQGFLGDEEQQVLEPALQQARSRGLRVRGPVAADTAFAPHSLAEADALLCMYHDQGLTAVKHGHFDEAVNLTLGLPFPRTSPDHGTALDLAGTGRVRAGSTLQAVRLAARLLTKAGKDA